MQKKIFIYLFFLLVCLNFRAQQIHVKYIHVRSPIATLDEDLYINNGKVISIQDSTIAFSNQKQDNQGSISYSTTTKVVNMYSYISNLTGDSDKERDFFFVEDKDYFVHDKVAKSNWNIDIDSSKKILGYNCIKATALYRGRKVTAYYTPDIPKSVGPYKFYGLPGLILELSVDGMSYYMWKATKVNLNDDTKVNYNPAFTERKKIDIKRYAEILDEKQNQFNKKLSSDLPSDIKREGTDKVQRFGIDRVYDWEVIE